MNLEMASVILRCLRDCLAYGVPLANASFRLVWLSFFFSSLRSFELLLCRTFMLSLYSFSCRVFKWWERFDMFGSLVTTCWRHILQITVLWSASLFLNRNHSRTTELLFPLFATNSSSGSFPLYSPQVCPPNFPPNSPPPPCCCFYPCSPMLCMLPVSVP